ncbi:MAG: hypothetical protein U0174_18000 [Polyangiaceae bacterium]
MSQSPTTIMFLSCAKPESVAHVFGKPIPTAFKLLADLAGNSFRQLRTSATKSKGVLPKCTVEVEPYAKDAKKVDSVGFHFRLETKLGASGEVDSKTIQELARLWEEVVAAHSHLPGFAETASVHPLKREVVAAAKLLQPAFRKAYRFDCGALTHHGSIQREKFFEYSLTLSALRP